MDKLDILKEFEAYIPQWCKKNKKPKPKKKFDHYWLLAWKDFCREYMIENYDRINQYYKEMEYKVPGIDKVMLQQENQDEEEQITEKEKSPSNDWEEVKRLMGL